MARGDEKDTARTAAIRERLRIVAALQQAVELRAELDAIISASTDRNQAARRLSHPPFSFSLPQATHVLDMPVATRTQLGRAALQEEGERLRQALQSSEDR